MPGTQGQQGQQPAIGPPGGGQNIQTAAAAPQAQTAQLGGAQIVVQPGGDTGVGGAPAIPGRVTHGDLYGPRAPSTNHNGCGYVKKPTLATSHGRGCRKTHHAENGSYIFPRPPILCLYATGRVLHGSWTFNGNHIFNNNRHHHVSWEGGAVYGGSQRDSRMCTDCPAPPKRLRVEEMFCH